MSSRLTKFFGRKGTRGRYDQEREQPSVVEEQTTVETKTEETKKKEDDNVDQKVDQEHGAEDKDANTNVKSTSTGKRAEQNILKNVVGTTSSGKPQGVYSRLWRNATEYKLIPVRYTSPASWVPNRLGSAVVYESCARLVGQSNHTLKHEPGFFPYAFIVGMHYLELIQVLRASVAAGDLFGADATALSRFEKFNPLEGIMIPEPCIPFLEALAAVKLDDIKYKWITPSHGYDFTAARTFETLCTPTFVDTIRPNIPYMLAALATFGSYTRTELPVRMSANRVFSPIDFENLDNQNPAQRQAVRFLNANRTFNGAMADGAAGGDIRNVLQMLGPNTPFQFWNGNYLTAHEEFRNSRFFTRGGINIALTHNRPNPESGNNLLETTNFAAFENILFLSKNNNPIWFQALTKHINTVARHFPGSKPFSQIAVKGGIEPSIIAQMKLEMPLNYTLTGAAAASDNYLYEDMRLGRTNYNQIVLYQNRFRDISASFSTSRGDVERNEELNSFTIATCANPPIQLNLGTGVQQGDDIHKIRTGKFFVDIAAAGGHSQVSRLGFTEATIAGEKPMYADFDEDFVKPAFSKTPTNA